jgi:hypothetical protein
MPRAFRGLTWAELAALLLAGLIAVIVGFRLLVPAAVWFQVGTISVSNATACEDLTVHYPRVIRHQFDGAWRVEIDRAVPGGWLPVATTATNQDTYQVDTVLPADDLVTFDWFTAGQIDCARIGPGIYRLTAVWTVNTGSWGGVMTRIVRRDATFEVLE